ncbi:MAG: NADH-quinone oxidoreductase subunit N [Rhizomicrobium sp.]
MTLQADVLVLLPELLLAIGAMVLLIGGVTAGDRAAGVVSWLAIALMAAAGWLVFAHAQPASAFGGAFVVDGFARFSKILILAGSALSILMADEFFGLEKTRRFELPVLMLLATLGMMLMVSASSFIALYMGLELQSLALYVLAAFNRDSLRSTEAGLKYFVLGALSSGMLLYGISLIYGFTGSTEFAVIAKATAGSGVNLGLIFGLVFLVAGLAFKVGAVPFHMWTPDVYEGSPTPVTAFFVTAAKVAAFALFIPRRGRAVPRPDPPVAADRGRGLGLVRRPGRRRPPSARPTSSASSPIAPSAMSVTRCSASPPDGARHPGHADLSRLLPVDQSGHVRLRLRHAPRR